jgi:hypothetical protein
MSAGTPVQVRLQDEECEALDSYRREQSNPPSRAAAVRELIRYAQNRRSSVGANPRIRIDWFSCPAVSNE